MTPSHDVHSVTLHPELTEDPTQLRWMITSCPYSLKTAAIHPDGPLVALRTAGLLDDVDGGPGWILTTVRDPQTWKQVAGEVRRAVRETAERVQEGQRGAVADDVGDTASCAVPDADLAEIAQEILREHIAPVAGAHGGRITICNVRHGVVHVELAGACHGCPAAVITLRQGFEQLLQITAPGSRVREV